MFCIYTSLIPCTSILQIFEIENYQFKLTNTCAFDSITQLLITSCIVRKEAKDIVKILSETYTYFQYVYDVSERRLSEHDIYETRCKLLLNLIGHGKPFENSLTQTSERGYTLSCVSNAAENLQYLIPNYPNIVDELLPCQGGILNCGKKQRIITRKNLAKRHLTDKNFETFLESFVAIKHITKCDNKVLNIKDFTCNGLREHRLHSTGK